MKSALSRRGFLAGAFRSRPESIRPPWAVEEALFLDLCARCDDCIRLCPEKIVNRGSGGFPVIQFQRGECTFCGDCLTACKEGALRKESVDQAPWNLIAVIGAGCLPHKGVVCHSCREACEPRAITLRLAPMGVGMPEIGGDCTGCGACVQVCPARSIDILKPAPEPISPRRPEAVSLAAGV
mgnify:CR=1 FL=1